jgi:hypothetical protein
MIALIPIMRRYLRSGYILLGATLLTTFLNFGLGVILLTAGIWDFAKGMGEVIWGPFPTVHWMLGFTAAAALQLAGG